MPREHSSKIKYLLPRCRGRQRTGFRRTTGIPSITRYCGRHRAGSGGQLPREHSSKIKYLLPRCRGRQRTGFRRTTGIPSISRYSGRHRAGSGGQLPREHSSKIKISSSPLSSPDTAEGTECRSGGQLPREHTYVDEARQCEVGVCDRGRSPHQRRYAPSHRVGMPLERARSPQTPLYAFPLMRKAARAAAQAALYAFPQKKTNETHMSFICFLCIESKVMYSTRRR